MDFAAWSAFVGLLLIVMGLERIVAGAPAAQHRRCSTSPSAWRPARSGSAGRRSPWRTNTVFLERLAEVVVLLSLFTSGLKTQRRPERRPLAAAAPPGRLSMVVTVGLIAAAGVLLLALPLGAAVLLGGILAPTDPVLASDVQVAEPTDRDRLRFGLTGEAGLNDGTAFPFVMLGLGLLGVHEIGAWGWRWFAIDVALGHRRRRRHRCRARHCRRPARAVPAPVAPRSRRPRRFPRSRPDRRWPTAWRSWPTPTASWPCSPPAWRCGGWSSSRARAAPAPAPREGGTGEGRRRPGSTPRSPPRTPTPMSPMPTSPPTRSAPGLHGARDAELQRADRARRRGRGGHRHRHAAVGGELVVGLVGLRRCLAAADPAACRWRWASRQRCVRSRSAG